MRLPRNLLAVLALSVFLTIAGCGAAGSNGTSESLPEFHVGIDSITLGNRELTEEEFFMKIAGLEERHRVVFDVYDRESSDYLRNELIPRLKKQVGDSTNLQALVEVEVREE